MHNNETNMWQQINQGNRQTENRFVTYTNDFY